MKNYRYLFGPVPSRRLGRSLGVDLTPCKTCSLDCIFCQLGRTTNKTLTRKEYVPVKEVTQEIDNWLEAGGNADYITLSGSGEPTLHSRFGEIIDFVRERSKIPVALLTNGTTLYLPEVISAASHANVVKVSLSAWDESSFNRINRPSRECYFKRLIEGERLLRQEFNGAIWMEVFLLWGINSIPSDVKKIAALTEEISPDRIQLNTAVRPPSEKFAVALPEKRMVELTRLFNPPAEVIAEFSSDQTADIKANENTILAMLQRRPCTAEQIAEVFNMHINEALKYLGNLIRRGQIRSERKEGNIHYTGERRESWQ